MKQNLRLLLILILFSQQIISQNTNRYKELIEESKKKVNTDRVNSLRLLQEALAIKNLSETAYMDIYDAFASFYKEGGSHYMALNYYYKELEIQERIDTKKSFFVLNNIGACYFYLEDYKKARSFWTRSLIGYEKHLKQSPNENNELEGTIIYNNLGVLEKQEGNYQKALEMLTKFRAKSISLHDTLKIIMANENISEVAIKLGNRQNAIDKLHEGLFLAQKINSRFDLASLSVKLGTFYFEQHNIDSCLYYLNKAYTIGKKEAFIDIQLQSSEKLSTVYEKQKNYQKAYSYLNIAKGLSEKITSDSNNRKVDMLELNQEEKIRQYQLTLQQQKREVYLISGIILLLLLSSLVFLMYKLQKSKTQKKVIEKALLAREIQKKNKEIRNNTIQLIQNTEIIKSAQKELEELRDNSDKNLKIPFSKILNDLKNSSQAFNKQEFEKLFLEIDNDFYKNLLIQFPKLTKNELRLCAFLKLNLSSKEISAITQQTPHSITVARSRLRKKLNLPSDESIIHYLMKL